ncbi:hypothetical protein [Nostoc sp.]|uniref:hypothetical protein n=1 Tax=Nostoc sp. TaxID=1180 RepID=UPI002FF75783
MVMLISYRVIQNFDNSEFQVNGHHRFKQRRQTTQSVGNRLCLFHCLAQIQMSRVQGWSDPKTSLATSIPAHQSILLRNIKVLAN